MVSLTRENIEGRYFDFSLPQFPRFLKVRIMQFPSRGGYTEARGSPMSGLSVGALLTVQAGWFLAEVGVRLSCSV